MKIFRHEIAGMSCHTFAFDESNDEDKKIRDTLLFLSRRDVIIPDAVHATYDNRDRKDTIKALQALFTAFKEH